MSVIVCTRDRTALLAGALPAVAGALRPGDELIVVDSASTGHDVRPMVERAGGRYLRVDEPGLSRARNAGWRAATHAVLLCTDDDCLPLPGWRDAAVRALAADRVGAVWGSVVADRDSGVPLSVGLSSLVELRADSDLSMAGHGACMGFRREALEAVGGFDVLLGAGGRFRAGEDKDAFDRLRRRGWRVVAAPDMAVTHVVHREDRQARRVMHGYGIGAGVIVRKRSRAGDGGGRLLVTELWVHGLLSAAYYAKHGQLAAASAALARASGVLRGWAAVRGWPVVAGHLQDRG